MELSHDITVLGSVSKFRGVCGLSAEARSWLEGFPRSPALDRCEIMHVGLAGVSAPYRIVRCRQTTLFFIATISGTGKVYVEGAWREIGAGTGCLLPPHMFHAFYALGRSVWEFAWVCCPPQHVLVSASCPILATFEAAPLRFAIEGMISECQGKASLPQMNQWSQLIDSYLRQFAAPIPHDERFARVWTLVTEKPGAPWSLERLAKEAQCGAESLRRQCLKLFNRSPMHQVIYLRMKRAAEMLVNSTDKVEAVAAAVGYQNPFVFSTTFKKWIGCTPSAYRASSKAGVQGPGVES